MRVGAALAAAALTAGSTAGAATANLSVLDFADRSHREAARQSLADYLSDKLVTNKRIETFEDFGAWGVPGDSGTSNPQSTQVGKFTGFGGLGSGGTAIKGGTAAEVRRDTSLISGRYDTDLPAGVLGGNWLDSNDLNGIRWTIGGLGKFNTAAFLLTDIEDVGGRFTLKVGDQSFADLAQAGGKRLANSNILLVLITLSEAVENLTVEMGHFNRNNDGFGIDGALIASVAPIPLPPAAALLFVGLAALVGVRRRRTA
jgi:hypothetical protein